MAEFLVKFEQKVLFLGGVKLLEVGFAVHDEGAGAGEQSFIDFVVLAHLLDH